MDQPEGTRRLLDLVEEPQRSALKAWMRHTRVELRLLTWPGNGDTTTSLLAACTKPREGPPLKVIVQPHPAGPEPGPLAGGPLHGLEPLSRPLEKGLAAFAAVAPVCGQIMTLALAGWNPGGPRLVERTVPEFLTSVLGDRVAGGGTIHEWLRDPANHAPPLPGGGPVLPDPLMLLDEAGPAATIRLPVLTGNAHGDLRPGNVIVSTDPDADPPERWFAGLSRFGTDAPLTHDPLHFVMAMIAPCLPGLPQPQRVALGEFLIDPAGGHRALVPNGLSDLVTSTSLATSAWARSVKRTGEWEDLHLPSVVACALLYAGRAVLPAEDRLWFTWLAGRAAAAFLASREPLTSGVPAAGAAALPPRAPLPAADVPVAGSAAPAGGFHTGVQIGDAFYQAQTIHVHPREHPPRAFGAEVPGAAWPDPRVPESGAPRRVRYFVGRERELTELRGLMEAGRASASVVAVHGMPGMGKTQFALEYARRFSADYSRMWWIAAGRPELLGEQFGGMATALGLAVQGDMRTVCAVLFDALRDHGRWLLVFDDAPDAEAVQAYVPASDALHVLITSRNPEWSALAAPLALGPLAAEESRELMSALLHEPGTTRAAPIAERLGHLPLAVAQTALFLRGAPLDPEEYAEELGSRTAGALDTKPVPGYGRTLAAVWTLSMDSLARSSPAAAELLRACAYLGDAPVPWNLLAAAAADLPEPLRAVAASPLRLAEAATDAARLGLLRIEGTSVRVHGLLQAFLRDTDPGPVPDLRPALARAHPGDPRDPCSWPGYGTVLPHALALDLPGSDDPACHRLHLDALRYLAVRGDTRTVLRLATEVRDRWRDTLGPDAEPVLDAAGLLSRAHHDLGAHREALVLDQEVYDRRGRLLGPGDPATLTAGHNLAVDLSALARGGDAPAGIAARAVELLETVVDARREVLGPRHPETLRSVHNLAAELHAEGRRDQARELCEEALSGLTEALEPDHPDVLRSAHLLALLLAGDEPERARRLNEDTLRRRAKVLGPRHLDTLRSAHSHARDLLLAGFPVLAAGQAKETWLAVCATAGEDHPEALRAAGLTARALRATGDHAGAYRLSEDTYRRSVRLLGEDHIETLRAADQYATDLRTAGELATAGDLTRRTTAALARLVRSRRPSPPDA